MEQTPATGIGEWDTSSFVNEQWDHHQFGGQALGFDGNHGQHGPDTGYHAPNTFISNASQLNPQLSASDNQPGLYRQFEFYQQPHNEVWPSQIPSSTPYGQEASLPQGYYAGHPAPADAGRTVDSRFAPVEEYQEHHIPVQDNPEGLAHGFGGHAGHGPNPQTDNYQHGNVTHWGQRIPTTNAGYLPNRDYDSPLATPQVANIQNQSGRGSPSFLSNQGPVSGPVQGYQVNHQPVENRQPQQQYIQAINGQPIQNHASIAQVTAPRTGSPLVVTQPQSTVKPLAVGQTLSHPHPNSRPQPNPLVQQLSQQVPNQNIPSQDLSSVQPQVAHRSPVSIPSPETNSSNAAGVKRRPTSEIQEPKASVKKAKVTPPVAHNIGSPSPAIPTLETSSPVGPFIVDGQHLEQARARPSGTWRGVPNLAIGETPVKLKKGTPTKRYVVIAAKGGRAPLLPNIARGWTPAESLGNHSDAYRDAQNDLDRQRADIRLEIEMRRGGSEIPSDWWKKLPRGDSTTEAKRMDPPPEPLNTAIRASESLRIHPSHKSNRQVLLDVFEDYYSLVLDKATALKNSPALEKLAKAAKIRAKNPASFSANDFETLRQELEPLRKQLECAIVEGLKAADPRVLQKIGEKGSVPVRLLNILINLINVGDANSSLAKAILRLFGTFTSVKRSQLDTWKFPSTKAKVEAQGDQEVKDLMTAIFDNASKNPEKDASETKSSKEMSSGDVKRATKVATRVPSGSLGAKRAREDDNGSDSRSSKKAATESKPSAVSSATVSNGKSAAGPAKPTTVAKPPSSKVGSGGPITGSGPAPASAKVRTPMLLSGKARPAIKQPAKAEAPKPLVKQEAAPKPQPAAAKVEAPKAVVSKPQAAAPAVADMSKLAKPRAAEVSQPSRLAALMAEIDKPKKVVAPTPPSVSAPDPNETEEQKGRRLRKEERRRLGLKVAFKGDDRLVEIREFTRHPDEIAFTTSGIGEFKSESKNKKEEGLVLKMSHIGELRPWEEPVAVDFEDIPQEKREKTFVTRGGLKNFTTEQQKFTEGREAKELMVVYTDPSDIPPTPKSPIYEPVLMYDDVVDGLVVSLQDGPDVAEIRQRELDQVQQGFRRAVYAAQGRLDSRSNPGFADLAKAMTSVSSIAQSYNGHQRIMEPAPTIAPVAQPRPELRIELDPALAEARDQQTYQLLISDRVKNFRELDPYDPSRPKTVRRHDYPDPHLQRVVDYLEDLFAFLRQSAPVVAEPSSGPPPIVAAPQPAAQDYSAAWAQYFAQQAQQGQQAQAQPSQTQQWYGQQQNAYAPAANPYLPAQSAQGGLPQTGADLAAILAAFGGQQAQNGAATPDAAQLQALMAALGQPQAGQPVIAGLSNEDVLRSVMQLAQQGQAVANNTPAAAYNAGYPFAGQQGPHVHPDRDRELRERDRERDRDRDQYHNNNRGKNKNRGRDRDRDGDGNGGEIPEHLRGINRSLIGTKQCSFWARGQCAKGDKCTFRHD